MDLISRDQALGALNGELIISGEDNVKAVEEYIHTTIRKLNDLPSIDAVPVKRAKLLDASPWGLCSECGFMMDYRENFNYCPNCGARMDGEENEQGHK